MKCITVQNINVLQKILKNSVYYLFDERYFVGRNRKDAYEFMKKEYRYANYPIFLSPVGFKVEMCGADFSDSSVAIEFDIPDNMVHMQRYYDWSDFLYYSNSPKEFQRVFYGYDDVYQFGKHVLTETDNNDLDQKEVYQATVCCLKKEWIIDVTSDLRLLEKKHFGSGGNNILKELRYYKEQ